MSVYGFDKKDALRVADVVKRVEHFPSGQTSHRRRHKNRGGSGTSTVPVKIKSKTNYNTYTADIYANGLDQTATAESATVRVLSIATTETIPNNTILFATPLSWPDVDDSSKRATYYTVDTARSY